MQYKKLKTSTLLMLSVGLMALQAQEAVTPSGGNSASSEGSISYTIGQIHYITSFETIGSVAQGVQQPFEISVVHDTLPANPICLAYPNPTTDFVILKVENYDMENLSYQLFDIAGKLIMKRIIVDNETPISMKNLAPTVYFLKVISSKRNIKTFKIIKY